jgi:hypothetical protein
MTRSEERAWEDLVRAAKRVKELQKMSRPSKSKKPRRRKGKRQ